MESLERKTPEGVTLKPLYGAADLERCEAVADPTQDGPGLFPYHRCVPSCLLLFYPGAIHRFSGKFDVG